MAYQSVNNPKYKLEIPFDAAPTKKVPANIHSSLNYISFMHLQSGLHGGGGGTKNGATKNWFSKVNFFTNTHTELIWIQRLPFGINRLDLCLKCCKNARSIWILNEKPCLLFIWCWKQKWAHQTALLTWNNLVVWFRTVIDDIQAFALFNLMVDAHSFGFGGAFFPPRQSPDLIDSKAHDQINLNLKWDKKELTFGMPNMPRTAKSVCEIVVLVFN